MVETESKLEQKQDFSKDFDVSERKVSQDFNDNVNNPNTELCFSCRKYNLKTDMEDKESENICKKCYGEFLNLCKKTGISFKEIPNLRIGGSVYWNGEYDITDVFALKEGKEVFIRGYAQDRAEYVFPQHEKADIFNLKMQFLNSNGKWINHYGQKSPLDFINWIKENKYKLQYKNWGIHKAGDFWKFHGNLEEISHAFNYHIFDEGLINKIKENIKEIKPCIKDGGDSE